MTGANSLQRVKENTKLENDKSPLLKSFVAGVASGTVSTIMLQPLDLVKTRLQKSSNLGSSLGMITELSNVIKKEKFRGLWTGLIPSLCRTVPGVGIFFTSIHWVKTTFGSVDPHPFESIVIGASCRSFAGVMVLPFTVMKTRYESGDFHYKSLRQALQTTFAKEGFKGLYSGLAPTLLRDVPYSGLYLMFYTKLKALTSDYSQHYSILFNFTNAMTAAGLSSMLTQPVDVIKTNMQLYPQRYGRLKNVFLLIYKESGLIGFQRGFVPRTVRRTLMSGITWCMYEEVMKHFNIKT